MRILVMCVANSARSQMAESLARHLLPESFEIQSAGSHPTFVHPMTERVLREKGLSTKSLHSKGVHDLSPQFLEGLDYVITLCAEEVCPTIVTKAHRIHWPMPDPAASNELGEQSVLAQFRNVRDEIESKFIQWKRELGI